MNQQDRGPGWWAPSYVWSPWIRVLSGSQDQVVLEGLGLRILIIGDRTRDSWIFRRPQGTKAWYWRDRDQETWGLQDFQYEEMTEEAKHHSPHPLSIPDLKGGASLPRLCSPPHPEVTPKVAKPMLNASKPLPSFCTFYPIRVQPLAVHHEACYCFPFPFPR